MSREIKDLGIRVVALELVDTQQGLKIVELIQQVEALEAENKKLVDALNRGEDMLLKAPKQEIIKLEEMVGSDILCDFSGTGKRWNIGKLTNFIKHSDHYADEHGNYWDSCRILQDHWHHWNGGECPLPEGLEIRVQYRDKQRVEGRSWQFLKTSWKHSADVNNDIIAFKVLGPADDARYEWQKKKEE